MIGEDPRLSQQPVFQLCPDRGHYPGAAWCRCWAESNHKLFRGAEGELSCCDVYLLDLTLGSLPAETGDDGTCLFPVRPAGSSSLKLGHVLPTPDDSWRRLRTVTRVEALLEILSGCVALLSAGKGRDSCLLPQLVQS